MTLHVEPSGFLDKSVLQLRPDGTAETELRSDGVGKAVVSATTPELGSATASLTYALPYLTLGASVLGGLIGSFVSFATAPRRKKGGAMRVIGAALFGVIVFVLYVIGINLLPVEPTVTVGAAFVFAFSALASWLGPSVGSWRRKLPQAKVWNEG